MNLEDACNLVERALKDLAVSQVTIEYSEGIELSGCKGSSKKVSLFVALKTLQDKINTKQ